VRFEKVSFEAFRFDSLRCGYTEEAIRVAYNHIKLPERKTEFSAGYDMVTPYPVVLHPNQRITIPTGIKVYFEPEEASKWHLALYIRSSVGIKQQVVMSNQTGVIDADFYNSGDGEGGMLIALTNTGDHYRRFEAGDRVIQGIFLPHGIVDGDEVKNRRTGGVGSTDDR
jgi:dUTP pyrophosphatase